MLAIRALPLLLALATPALAAAPHVCSAVDGVQKATEASGGQWIRLTDDQWKFMRGIYAIYPYTPAGLPYGDQAWLALVPIDGDRERSQVFFVDGDRACDPVAAPKALRDIIDAVEAPPAHAGDRS